VCSSQNQRVTYASTCPFPRVRRRRRERVHRFAHSYFTYGPSLYEPVKIHFVLLSGYCFNSRISETRKSKLLISFLSSPTLARFQTISRFFSFVDCVYVRRCHFSPASFPCSSKCRKLNREKRNVHGNKFSIASGTYTLVCSREKRRKIDFDGLRVTLKREARRSRSPRGEC
jgi:hypothetical protein